MGGARERESLWIRGLGPIADLRVRPRPLTVIVGEQTTGKSLVAQLLYFFRGLASHVASHFATGSRAGTAEQISELLARTLDDLRGAPFCSFAEKTAILEYADTSAHRLWRLAVRDTGKIEVPRSGRGSGLFRTMSAWIDGWRNNPETLGGLVGVPQVFIPTERSLFTRLMNTQPQALFAQSQPYPLRVFSALLQKAHSNYRTLYSAVEPQVSRRKRRALARSRGLDLDVAEHVFACQQRALKGVAFPPAKAGEVWSWRLKRNGASKSLPLEAVASGQAETWPFFVIAATFGAFEKCLDFYFEEPETHLHPRAQLEVVNAIVRLVNAGHTFTITTHSPYILYALNNMIQRGISRPHPGHVQGLSIAPGDVVAYRLGREAGRATESVAGGLIDASELEDVADELGGQFEELLGDADK